MANAQSIQPLMLGDATASIRFQTGRGYPLQPSRRAQRAQKKRKSKPTSQKVLEEAYEVYECVVCLDETPLTGGVCACSTHFFCYQCLINTFERSINNTDEFPAACCRGKHLSYAQLRDVLSEDFIAVYKKKLDEYYTPYAVRVYCINRTCAKFRPRDTFDDTDDHWTVASCECGTKTCVGCKQAWDDEHRCDTEEDPRAKPEWMPEYTSTCRIKRCPGCRMWMEHKEACNHMTCSYCHHEFCFVCLADYHGMHYEEGSCPMYGDPPEGYDEEGYEKSARAIHRADGFNREGFNAEGRSRHGQAPTNAEHTIQEDMNNAAHGRRFDDAHLFDNEPMENLEHVHDDRQVVEGEGALIGRVEQHDDELQGLVAQHTQTGDGEVHQNDLSLMSPVLPYISPYPTMNQIVCTHSFSHVHCGGYTCRVCHFNMPYFHNVCTSCQIQVCDFCSNPSHPHWEVYLGGVSSLVAPIQWAEQGYAPCKADRTEARIVEPDIEAVPLMFDRSEKALWQAQPWWYCFGTQELFENAELEAERAYAAVKRVFIKLDSNRVPILPIHCHENLFDFLDAEEDA